MTNSKLEIDKETESFLKLSSIDKIVFMIIDNSHINFNKIFEMIGRNNNMFLSMKNLENDISDIIELPHNKQLLSLISEYQKLEVKLKLCQYISITMIKNIFTRNQDISEQILLNNVCSCHSPEN